MTGGPRQDLPVPSSALDDLFDRLVAILDRARERVVRSVNSEMVLAYWHIGREIVQIRQNGEARDLLPDLRRPLSGDSSPGS